jgi:hypothetical protein
MIKFISSYKLKLLGKHVIYYGITVSDLIVLGLNFDSVNSPSSLKLNNSHVGLHLLKMSLNPHLKENVKVLIK